jgi:hypothetical protein
MNNPKIQTLPLRSVDDLQQTAGICRGHNARAGGSNMFDLSFKEVVSHFRLDKIINPRAAAAPRTLRQFDELPPGKPAQQFARL